MPFLRERAIDLEVVEDESARTTIYQLGRSVLVTVGSGHPGLAHVELLIRRSEQLIAVAGSIAIVHDWFSNTGYKPEVRRRATPWLLKTRGQHRAVHVGTASQIVRMGIAMVQTVTQAPIVAHATLVSLEHALLREVAAERGR